MSRRAAATPGGEAPQSSFLSWQKQTASADIMATAEKLLDSLEDTAELLNEIDEKYIVVSIQLITQFPYGITIHCI
jgi:hypothetical protein